MEDDVEKRHLAASERQKMKRLEAASPRREATSCRFVRINENIKIAYCLERKPVKNLNLRIRRDGSVYVSANMDVSCAEVDRFVLNKAEYVLAAIRKFKAACRFKPQPKKYVSGETFCILGRSLRLKVLQAPKESISSDGAYIYLGVKDPMNCRSKSRLVRRFMDQQFQTVFADVMDKMFPLVGKYGVKYPMLKMRSLKTRWGSCLVRKGVVTLNRGLIEAPMCCIEYVVLHELCHFIHPNHSEKFYAFLSALMPDWRERKKLLNRTMADSGLHNG